MVIATLVASVLSTLCLAVEGTGKLRSMKQRVDFRRCRVKEKQRSKVERPNQRLLAENLDDDEYVSDVTFAHILNS